MITDHSCWLLQKGNDEYKMKLATNKKIDMFS